MRQRPKWSFNPNPNQAHILDRVGWVLTYIAVDVKRA